MLLINLDPKLKKFNILIFYLFEKLFYFLLKIKKIISVLVENKIKICHKFNKSNNSKDL